MKSLCLFALPLIVAIAAASTPAQAGSCTTAANTGSKVWKHAGPVVKNSLKTTGPVGATAAQVASFVEQGVKLWNKIAKDDSWAKIGPRRLDIDKGFDEGTLVGPTERLFLTGVPATNPVIVDINKVDHNGKVKVVVCMVPEKGSAKEVKSFTIDKDTKKGNLKSIKIPNAKGHVIAVALHGKSVGKKLKYKVRVKNSDFLKTTSRSGSGSR
jgi:hypothetical protein